ncbi:MAG: DUF58 domain-containing protein [Planctomycetota bacterium]|jgi:uncharacterized protein (DUF58 family)|nr:DUF58 domain-containing protein [Planctomycetota bacterium]|tara:strand:- start:344 stop:1234 length:891 start_codon:yes stop_codon:yes gene_type:complete
MSETTHGLLSPSFLNRLEQLELVSRKVFLGQMRGERRSPRQGISVEFSDYRNYVPGDDLRFIDWNIYGRLDRLFLKLFLEEEDLHVYLLLDTSQSMAFGDPEKLHYAKQIAAALGYIGLTRSDRVIIESVAGDSSLKMPPLRGKQQGLQMLEFLELLQTGGGTSLAQSLRDFSVRNSGRGIVVLISDLMDKDGYESGLRYLLAKQMDIYVIHLLSQEELNPDYQGDLRLVDSEDGDIAEITVNKPLVDRYKNHLKAYCDDIKNYCIRRGIFYLLTDNHIPMEKLILEYLRQRRLVR